MEIPSSDLSVSFLVSMEDVTEQVLSQIKDVPADQLSAKLQEVYDGITKKAKEGNHYEAFVRDMYKGNQYYLFIMEKFTDIRLVGTPPEAIGKFGGDTDNWMWPCHQEIFPCSVFMPTKTTSRRPTAKTMCLTNPNIFCPYPSKGLLKGTMP
jgi:hypothetical protein